MFSSIVKFFPSKDITFSAYTKTVKVLIDYCFKDIQTLLAVNTRRRTKIILVAIERGGNVPATLINYAISDGLQDYIKENKAEIHSLHCSISTRDKKPGSNAKALLKLKTEIRAIVKAAPFGVEDNSRIYFIDDLLDSGETIRTIHNALNKEAWYDRARYLFVYSKQSAIQTLSTVDFQGDYLGSANIEIGKNLKTRRWLSFWYEVL